MTKKLLGLEMSDDVSAVSKKTAESLDALSSKVKVLGEAFKKANTGNLIVKLKDAKQLFKDSGQNINAFRAALKVAGTSALDTSLLVNKMTDELRKQRRAALGMDGLFKRIFNPRTIWVASHALNVLSKGYGALSTAAGGAGAVLGKGAELGKGMLEEVIESAEERENTIIALKETFHGSPEEKSKQAEEVYDWIRKAAQQTPLETPYLIEVAKKLGEGGFHDVNEIKVLASMVADQQTKFKGDYGMQTVEALTRLKSRSFAGARDFESFRVAGFELSDIYAQMADKLGVKEKDPLRSVAMVRYKLGHALTDVVKSGKNVQSESLEDVDESPDKASLVSSYTLINSLIAAQEGKFGQLGSFALKNSESLTGAISNFKGAFGDLLKTTDITQWPGILALKDLMVRVQRIMLDTGGAGGTLLKGVKASVDALLGGLKNVTDQDIEAFLTKVGDFAIGVADAIKKVWDWLNKLVHSDDSFVDTLADTLLEVGAYIGAGIWKGVKGGVAAIQSDKLEKKYGTKGMDNVFDYQAKLHEGLSKKQVAEEFSTTFSAFKKSGGVVKPWAGESMEDATWRTVQDWKKTQVVQDSAQSLLAAGSPVVQDVLSALGLSAPKGASPSAASAVGQALVGGGAAGGAPSVVVNMPLQVIGNEDPHKLQAVLSPNVHRTASAAFARLARE